MTQVLLIEDDSAVRENTAELLELSNYEVITGSNGKNGLRKAVEYLPDIIVCDIMMPEMDGYGVLKALSERAETVNIPFIFLSAKTEHSDVRKGMDLGADDYLVKPFEEEDLINAVESRLAKVSILESFQGEQQAKKQAQDLSSLNDLKSFMADYPVLSFAEGEYIYESGKQSNFIYLVKRGVVKAHRIDEKGKELITELYRDNDFFGNATFGQADVYNEFATAMEATELYAVSKRELHEILANNGKLTLDLVEVLSKHLTGVKDQLMEMAYGTVRKKTANTILLFAERMRKHPLKSIRIARSDLANVAGMAPESLIRTLSGFKKEGLIEIEGRNIEILDSDALKKVS